MASKKFNKDLLQERREKERQEKATIGIETTKAELTPQARGEKRKYTRLTPRENRTKVVTVLLTEREYDELVSKAEELEYKSVSEFIRQAINDRVRAF